MPGIYIHVPFCKQACHYCDFHFSTTLSSRHAMLESLRNEIHLRKDYLGGEEIDSVYFGGGTPSLLTASELNALMDALSRYHRLSRDCEITLEANPDDLGTRGLASLRATPINRLSIGIQSFFDEDLKWMNRVHTGMEALDCIRASQDAGFENLTVDLIYGYPLLSDSKWLENIQQATELGIQHLSCYNLTVEAGTALSAFIKNGKERPLSSTQGARQFEILMDEMDARGFQHYEISNFCKEGWHSRHNTSYWQEKPYLGIGPSAHSYNGWYRSWNRASNHQYIQAIQHGENPAEAEKLTVKDRLNERILTQLRTMWGLDLDLLEKDFGRAAKDELRASAADALRKGWVREDQGKFILSREGKCFADRVVSDLFFTDEWTSSRD